ncbi:MarR family winged helix-turn-helix transcriptional regulator [Shewanella algae]|uniref:MarR family winged helix-turn-helix transcriptional regulator n=1 Tax=Shewanella algae TaxID=38313 RepID=UPI0008F8CDCB|nr:hypothetical protein BFS86_08985 [Shewanella algae]
MSKTAKIRNLSRALEILRDIEPEMTIQQLQVLLEIMCDEGVGGKEMEKRVKQTQSSASRNMRLFTKMRAPGKPGLDLVEWRPDPGDFRRKCAHLTDKGVELRETLMATL